MVRKYRAADMSAVMGIWLESNIDGHPFIDEEYWRGNYDAVKEMLPQAEIRVFERDGRIYGFIGLNGNHIEGIFVRSEYRSEGIGKELLESVKCGHNRLTLNVYRKNERAIQFYRRNGFVVDEETVDMATGETEYIMKFES